MLVRYFYGYLNAENNFKETAGNYGVALINFSAAVIRADRHIYNVELKFVQKFLSKQYNLEVAFGGMQLLKKVLKQKPDLETAFTMINADSKYYTKLHTLYFLFSLAFRDRKMDVREINVLRDIALGLNIREKDYISIRAMFTGGESKSASSKQGEKQQKSSRPKASYIPNAYKVLGINSTASIPEIKNAFRKMAVLHHPDKVAHLGEAHRKTAKEKFQHINQAYQYLQRKKGFK